MEKRYIANELKASIQDLEEAFYSDNTKVVMYHVMCIKELMKLWLDGQQQHKQQSDSQTVGCNPTHSDTPTPPTSNYSENSKHGKKA